MAIVYQHKTSDTNSIFYVGIGKTRDRAFSLKKRSEFHKYVREKHGMIVEILNEGIDWEEACKIEKELIKTYGRRGQGNGILVNMTDGGDGLNNPSEETRAKISKGNTVKKRTDEFKKNQSIRMIGNKNLLNYKHDEPAKRKMRNAVQSRDRSAWTNPERCRKISEHFKGVPLKEETKQKISNSLKGRSYVEKFGEKRSEEIKAKFRKKSIGQKRPKQSQAMKGRFTGKDNPMYGRHHSEEFKQKRREYFLTDKNPGKNKSEETIKKISQAKMGIPSPFKGVPRKKVICPHCGKEGGDGTMQRWHFDKCKFKSA